MVIDLHGDYTNTTSILIGIDGGATNTRCIAADQEGRLLARGISGPSNQGFGTKNLRQLHAAIKNSISQTMASLNQNTEVKSVCLGMTGLNKTLQSYETIENVVLDIVTAENLEITGDMQIALEGASVGKPGIVIYAGTGVNCYGKDEGGNEAWAGGWGYVIDDEGGGYDIGRKALTAVFRAYDGREKNTMLTHKILEHFSCESLMEVCKHIYSGEEMPRSEIGCLAPLVSEAAKEGDKVAKKILFNASISLVKSVEAVARKLSLTPDNSNIYTAGGVFKAGQQLVTPFCKNLKKRLPKFQVVSARFPPAIGAIFLAADKAGLKVDKHFLRNIRETIQVLNSD